jgi:hypothetical protein
MADKMDFTPYSRLGALRVKGARGLGLVLVFPLNVKSQDLSPPTYLSLGIVFLSVEIF